MIFISKIRRHSVEIEELKARLDALETRSGQIALPVVELPIGLPDPIAPAIVAPLPRKRGRPPKPKS